MVGDPWKEALMAREEEQVERAMVLRCSIGTLILRETFLNALQLVMNYVESGRGKRRKQGARAREGRSFYEGIHHVLGG